MTDSGQEDGGTDKCNDKAIVPTGQNDKAAASEEAVTVAKITVEQVRGRRHVSYTTLDSESGFIPPKTVDLWVEMADIGGFPDEVERHVDKRRSGYVGLLYIYDDGSWEFDYEYGENVVSDEREHEDKFDEKPDTTGSDKLGIAQLSDNTAER